MALSIADQEPSRLRTRKAAAPVVDQCLRRGGDAIDTVEPRRTRRVLRTEFLRASLSLGAFGSHPTAQKREHQDWIAAAAAQEKRSETHCGAAWEGSKRLRMLKIGTRAKRGLRSAWTFRTLANAVFNFLTVIQRYWGYARLNRSSAAARRSASRPRGYRQSWSPSARIRVDPLLPRRRLRRSDPADAPA